MNRSESTQAPDKPWREKNAALLVAVAVAAGILVRYLVHMPTLLTSDSSHYLLLAQSLVSGDGFTSGGSQFPDVTRLPALPMMTALIARLTGGVDAAATFLVHMASVLIVLPMYFLARRAFGPDAGLAVLPLAAVSVLTATAAWFLPTPLFLVLGLSSVAMTWSALERSHRYRFLLGGLLAGASAMSRIEGLALIVVLFAWTLVPWEGRRRILRDRIAPCLLLLAGALALYGPYVGWVSLKMGRLSFAPSIRYLLDMRLICDRLDLRHIEGPRVHWTERARFLLDADHERIVLDAYFGDRVLPAPDPEMVPGERQILRPEKPASLATRVKRRAHIFRHNLPVIPRALYQAAMLPVVPLLLGLAGAVLGIRIEGKRRAFLFLFTAGIVSLAPVLSHVEARFFYLPMAIGFVVSAGGWVYLDRHVAKRLPEGLQVLRWTVHAVIAVLILIGGLQRPVEYRKIVRTESLYREMAREAALRLPEGPVLAVRSLMPYWAGRSYRPIPVGNLDAVLDYARAQGAAGLFLDGSYDLGRRPHLAALVSGEGSHGFTRVYSLPSPRGGEALLFSLDPGDSQ